jgi:hypothetical protein
VEDAWVRGLHAELTFGEPHMYLDRRTAAKEAQADVEGIRANGPGIIALRTPVGNALTSR